MRQGFNSRRAWVVAGAMCVLACRGAELDLRLATLPCAPRVLSPLDGVSELKVTIHGPGISPTPVRVALAALSLELPDVLAGKDRNVVVEALQGDLVVSRGESGPIDLDTYQPVSTSIFLRRLDGFTPTGTPDGTCTQLAELYDASANDLRSVQLLAARVGHGVAASVVNGRVILVGGFDNQGAPLRSTEVYRPDLTAFVPGPELPSPRGGATAQALENGSILVADGWDGVTLAKRCVVLVPDVDGACSRAEVVIS